MSIIFIESAYWIIVIYDVMPPGVKIPHQEWIERTLYISKN